MQFPFFKGYENVYYEYIDVKTPQEQLDSIYGSLPRYVLTVETIKGKKFVMKTYNMPVMPGSTLGGKPIDYHPERMYAYTSELGEDTYTIVQNLTYDKLAPSLENLQSSTTVEK